MRNGSDKQFLHQVVAVQPDALRITETKPTKGVTVTKSRIAAPIAALLTMIGRAHV